MAGEIEKGGAAEKAEPTPLESYRDKAKKWAIGLLVALHRAERHGARVHGGRAGVPER